MPEPVYERIAQAERRLADLLARRGRETASSPLLEDALRACEESLDDLRALASRPAEAPDRALQAIYDTTTVSLAYLDTSLRFVAVNDRYIERSGYTREQLIGAAYGSLFADNGALQVFERVLATGKSERYYFTPYPLPIGHDQDVAYYDWSAAAHRTADGETLGVVISSVESTWLELSRREREARLQSLNNLVRISEGVLKEESLPGVLRAAAEGAAQLTGAQRAFGAAWFQAGETVTWYHSPPAAVNGEQHDRLNAAIAPLLERLDVRSEPLRLNEAELAAWLQTWGLSAGEGAAGGLVAVPLKDEQAVVVGGLFVWGKPAAFDAEDEGSLTQLAALTSLACQHLQAVYLASKSARDLRAVFDSLTEAVVVCDTDGRTTGYNQAAVQLAGPDVITLERGELARVLDFRRENGDKFERTELPVYRALRGEHVSGEVITFSDTKGVRKEMLTTASPLYEGERIAGAVTVWYDITDRERTRRELAEERALLSAVIENAPVGIIVIDAQQRLVLANPAAQRLFRQPSAQNAALADILHHRYLRMDGREFLRDELPLMRALREQVTSRDVEIRVVWEDNHESQVLVSAAPLTIAQPPQPGAVVLFQDITLNRRVSQALQRRVRDLRLLNQLGRELGSTHEKQRVLEGVLAAVHRLVSAVGTCVLLWDDVRPEWLACEGCYGNEWKHEPLGERVHPHEPLWSDLLVDGRTILAGELSEAPALAAYIREWLGIDSGSLLAVPLKVRDRILGIILVASREPHSFKSYERMMLETLAPAAAVAIENTELLAVTERTAAANERSRLARELHDAVSQTLFSASIIAETLPRLAERDPSQLEPGLAQLQQLTRSALAEMRALLLELRPNALLETSLPELLRQLAEAAAGRTSMQLELDLDPSCTVPPEVHLGIYRIAQEALNNIIKHARATLVRVTLRRVGQGVELLVSDNGRGFDPAAIRPGHLGLEIIRERAEALNMPVSISTLPGKGTELALRYHAEPTGGGA